MEETDLNGVSLHLNKIYLLNIFIPYSLILHNKFSYIFRFLIVCCCKYVCVYCKVLYIVNCSACGILVTILLFQEKLSENIVAEYIVADACNIYLDLVLIPALCL